MRKPQDLFTTGYAVEYEGWVKLEDFPILEQFREVYLWCNYLVYTWSVNYYLMLKIFDRNGKVVFEGYVPNMYQFSRLKKKLKLTNCTLYKTIYLGPQSSEQSIILTYEEFSVIPTASILELSNEICELLPTNVIPGIILELTTSSPQQLIINGVAPAEGTYSYVLIFRGLVSGKLLEVPLTIIATPIPTPPVYSVILLEDGFIVLTEDNNYILTE